MIVAGFENALAADHPRRAGHRDRRDLTRADRVHAGRGRGMGRKVRAQISNRAEPGRARFDAGDSSHAASRSPLLLRRTGARADRLLRPGCGALSKHITLLGCCRSVLRRTNAALVGSRDGQRLVDLRVDATAPTPGSKPDGRFGDLSI